MKKLSRIEIVGSEGAIPAGIGGAMRAAAEGLIALARRQLADEAAIRAFATDLLRHGPSGAGAHLPAGFDLTRSWSFEEQFFYEVRSRDQRAILVSSLIDRGYAINTVWFVDANIAIAMEEHGTDVPRFNRFLDEALRRGGSGPQGSQRRRLVLGFPHMLHMLWNSLTPVVDLARAFEEPAGFELHVLFEPYGPVERLIPELRHAVTRATPWRTTSRNNRYAVSCGVGGWRISRETQSRIVRLAGELASPGARAASAAFAARFGPVIWITAKPGDRSFIDEASVLATLIARLAQHLPNAGFIVNGASYPWDFRTNIGYDGFFRNHINDLTTSSASHIGDIVDRLPAAVRDRVAVVNGVDVQDEIVWGGIADFYIAHGGSMQHKIGWIHDIPGYVHSNRRFVDSFRQLSPLEAETVVHYAPDGILQDDAPSRYSPLQLVRKDQRYAVIDQDAFHEDILLAMAASGIGQKRT